MWMYVDQHVNGRYLVGYGHVMSWTHSLIVRHPGVYYVLTQTLGISLKVYWEIVGEYM